MDIYSAARRLRKPYLITRDTADDDFSIGAHGLIGDGITAALVRVDGAIDWLCLPRFDSPSVFASILDPHAGGKTSISPVHRPFEALQRYDSDTNVLETLFEVADHGVVRLTDYMPWTDDPRASIHEVHRRVECLEGRVELEVVFDPRFGYGTRPPQLHLSEHGVMAEGEGGERLAAAFDGANDWQSRAAGGRRCVVRLERGQLAWFVLSWGAPRVEPIAAYRPFEHLRTTRRLWRAWSSRLRYDGPWRHHVLRSALVLKLLQYLPSGGMVAAPTMALPEWVGGSRNWDYRYVWTRDAALCVRSANLIGYAAEARDFFHFVRDTLDGGTDLAIMYTVDGGEVPEERELANLRGFQGSAPVRCGNGARHQLQLDNAGYLLDAAHVYEQFGGSLTLRAWRHLVSVLEALTELWDKKDHGIWEPRGEMQHNVHSKLMCWVAFERGLRIAQLFGDHGVERSWRKQAEAIETEIFERGLNPSGQHFVSHYGGEHADAALLLLPVYGIAEPNDPLVERTIRFVREELSDHGYIRRYLADDGLDGDEGAFILCGFWLAEALALAGHLDEAQKVFVHHAEAANHVGLLSEEIEPSSNVLLGNFPQGFSHMGLINAAARIDLAIRLQDERTRKHPMFFMDL
mgnify:CR=1 FL=1